ncbi:MAG: hypothetical protein K6F49_13435 [Saccharofermentans sp.]|nr:hypothetical protein [Saccharofermentans sp.]
MKRGMLKLYSSITVAAMAFTLSPAAAVNAIGGDNEISLVTATDGGSLTATLECGGVDLINTQDPTISYGDTLICDLNWEIPDGFTLTTSDVLVYNLPDIISFEQKTGDIMNGNDDIGDYEIVGHQIRLNYTSEDFCAEDSRHGHLAFAGSIESDPNGGRDPADVDISFEGIADITVHIVPPTTTASLAVDKVFHVQDDSAHIYTCTIPVTAHGDQTNIVVRDTMWPGMELYGGMPVIYTDSGLDPNSVFTDHTGFAMEAGDGRSFSTTINNLSDGQTVYVSYRVQVRDEMYDYDQATAFINGLSNANDYYPNGYEGTVTNKVSVNSDQVPTPVVKLTAIYGSGYSFMKWRSAPYGDELTYGYIRWQLYVNKITNDTISEGYIVDTLPQNNSFDPANVIVYSGDPGYASFNAADQVTITTSVNDQGRTVVRFDFTPEFIANLKAVNNGIYIEYLTHVDSQTQETVHYENTASLYYNGVYNSTRADSIDYTKPAEVDKVGIYNASTAPYANYTVSVNPAAMDLDPNSDSLTFTDTMGSALDLVTGSVVVKDIYGNVIPNDTLTYDPATHTFTLTLNDQQAYIVTYSAAVNLVAGSTLDDTNATNTCALTGVVTSGEDGTVVIRSRVYDNSASSSSVIGAATLNIIKHDDDSTAEVLSGAQFSVQTAALSGSNVTTVSDFTSATTDASGRISINNIARGTCYMITETDAPSGYQLDDAPRFIIFSESSNSTYPSTVTYNGSTYSVEVISNTRASYDLYIANSEIVTGSNPQPTQPTETSAPTETTQPSETSTPTQTAAPSETTAAPSATTTTTETTTTPSVDATAATTAATTATEPSVDASAATRPTTTTTTTTAPSETTAPAPSILGASRVQNEEADPTTASSEETTTTTAPAATPTAAPSGTSSTPSTGESGNATVLVGTIVIAAAALCFVFYVRKSKKEHN